MKKIRVGLLIANIFKLLLSVFRAFIQIHQLHLVAGVRRSVGVLQVVVDQLNHQQNHYFHITHMLILSSYFFSGHFQLVSMIFSLDFGKQRVTKPFWGEETINVS